MAGNIEDAQDLTQEVFVSVFRNIDSFRAEAAFGTWLYRIATNQCLNRDGGTQGAQSAYRSCGG